MIESFLKTIYRLLHSKEQFKLELNANFALKFDIGLLEKYIEHSNKKYVLKIIRPGIIADENTIFFLFNLFHIQLLKWLCLLI